MSKNVCEGEYHYCFATIPLMELVIFWSVFGPGTLRSIPHCAVGVNTGGTGVLEYFIYQGIFLARAVRKELAKTGFH